MAKYTTTIRHLMDNNYDFGLANYPLFDETYRPTLNQNILNYYYMYEIGFEVPNLFRHYLNTKMNLIMPKYNVYYEYQKDALIKTLQGNVNLKEAKDSENSKNQNIKDNDASTVKDKITETTDSVINNTGESKTATGGSSSSKSDGSSSNNDRSTQLYQDTPQGKLDQTALENQTWATNLTQTKSEGTGTTSQSGSSETNSNSDTTDSSKTVTDLDTTRNREGSSSHDYSRTLGETGTDNYVKTLIGLDGRYTYMDLLKQYIDNFRNIDQAVIDELKDLFMGVL